MNPELDPQAAKGPPYIAGTLSYTLIGLISLFGWLLWGDFVLTFMETVMPSLLPLILKDHGASNREIITIVGTIAMIMNSLMNPVISYNSDRMRSRWGRRRPFIFITTPFVVLFLAAIPFAPEILRGVSSIGPINHLLSRSPIAPLILMFGFLVAGFQLFNMFIGSVYYYLVPDVVPTHFIGRFYGLFRIFGTAAALIFNYFIFGFAEGYMKPIFVGTAFFYGFFILLMCWRVKEGEYPPPLKEAKGHWWSGIQNYAQECYGHAYYWWVFLTYSALGWGGAGGTFAVFFYRDELKFSLDLYGKMLAWGGFLFIVLSYPIGALMDRWGCHKVLIVGTGLVCGISLAMFFFAVNQKSAICWAITLSLSSAISSMALAKWTIEVYPHARYGQFGSAGALFSSLGGIIAAFVFAWWMDWIKEYRYFLIWNAIFAAVCFVSSNVVYRRWKSLGGLTNYSPP